jgi:hypothetical protein
MAAADHARAPMESLRRWASDLLRGFVRCLFPLAMLLLAAGLLYSPQGGDVLRVLIEQNADDESHRLSGLIFLWAASGALALSLWYSMRWLLTAQMPGLPLCTQPGWLRRWLPRGIGAAVPALVAHNLVVLAATSSSGMHERAQAAAWWFGALAVVLLVLLRLRGPLLERLVHAGWLASDEGRRAGNPDVLEVNASLPLVTKLIVAWGIGVTLLIAGMMMLFPVSLPRVIQAAAVALIALASINLLGSFVLSYWPLRSGLPHLAPWVLLVGGALGAWNDNHVVHPAVDPARTTLAALRDPVAELAPFLKADGALPPAVVFVASEGGGIRAAYWTAAVMQELTAQVDAIEGRVAMLSGVSGGSLGLASWLAVQRAHVCPHRGTSPPERATDSLALDYVSPGVAGMLYYDLIQRFVPWPVAAWDRSRALEGGWQRAFARQPDQPFELTLDAFYAGCRGLPQLLLNSTIVETGQRTVLSLLDTRAIDQGMSLMSGDFVPRYQSLAGLVHHSARFPLLSPAATVTQLRDGSQALDPPRPRLRLVDGGYYDNSGVDTLTDLIEAMRRGGAPAFRPVLLLIENDPKATRQPPTPAQLKPSGWFPEAGSVLGAMLAVRGAHADAAKLRARAMYGCDVIALPIGGGSEAAHAPLGWALSDHVRKALSNEAFAAVQRIEPVLRARLRSDAPPCPQGSGSAP